MCCSRETNCPTTPPSRPSSRTSQHLFHAPLPIGKVSKTTTTTIIMKAILQRVHSASVTVDGQLISAISRGILVFAAVGQHDTKKEAETLASKVLRMKIWDGEDGAKVCLHCVQVIRSHTVWSILSMMEHKSTETLGECRRYFARLRLEKEV